MEEAVKKAVADAHEQAAEEAESTVKADAEPETAERHNPRRSCEEGFREKKGKGYKVA